MLVLDYEGEQFYPGQPRRLYDALTAPRDYVKLTAAQGAQLHCSPMAATALRGRPRLARQDVDRPGSLQRALNTPGPEKVTGPGALPVSRGPRGGSSDHEPPMAGSCRTIDDFAKDDLHGSLRADLTTTAAIWGRPSTRPAIRSSAASPSAAARAAPRPGRRSDQPVVLRVERRLGQVPQPQPAWWWSRGVSRFRGRARFTARKRDPSTAGEGHHRDGKRRLIHS